MMSLVPFFFSLSNLSFRQRIRYFGIWVKLVSKTRKAYYPFANFKFDSTTSQKYFFPFFLQKPVLQALFVSESFRLREREGGSSTPSTPGA